MFQNHLHQHIQELLAKDSQSHDPVVQSLSLFFWANLERWVEETVLQQKPFIIALTGASGSGKSFIREILVDKIKALTSVSAFTQDNYYRDFKADFPDLPISSFYDEINLDDPDHIRFQKMSDDLNYIKQATYHESVTIPKLIYGTPTSKPTIVEQGFQIKTSPFIVTEGIHAFYDQRIVHQYNLKIFVDIDEDARRQRWLMRNQLENRGTTDNMWNTTVDSLNNYILPKRHLADLVINNTAEQESVVAFLDNLLGLIFELQAKYLAGTVSSSQSRDIA